MKDARYTIKIHGGLGNQMFQYALGRSLSLEKNIPVSFDPSPLFDITPRKNFVKRAYSIPSVFSIDPSLSKVARWEENIKIPYFATVFNKYYPRVFAEFGQWAYIKEKSFAFDRTILSINESAYLDGYWQSEKYFQKQREVIRNDFTFRDTLSGKGGDLATDILSNTSICLHVRRGDYIHNPVARAHHNVMTEDYHERALKIIKNKIGVNLKVFCFSDDIDWCRKNLRIAAEHVFVGEEYAGRNAGGHLQLMSLCKHFIIANSSFSWWGAWLSDNRDKLVIAPKKWVNDPNADTRDITPGDWMRI